MFRIGDFAAMAGISVRMLRHYHRVGLLAPAATAAGSRYRYYSAEQLPRLRRILALRDLGFRLGEIAPLVVEDAPTYAVRSGSASMPRILSAWRRIGPTRAMSPKVCGV